jgi:hypothetical protein
MEPVMWTAPHVWYLDAEGNPTDDNKEGNTPLISNMPLAEAVKLGIAEKDGTPIAPKDVKKAIRAKAKEEKE